MSRDASLTNVCSHSPNGRLEVRIIALFYLEEHLDFLLVERQIAYLIDDKQLWGHDTVIECNFVGALALDLDPPSPDSFCILS